MNTGIECGHHITLDGKVLGWALRAGTVQTGQVETVWIETVSHYDLVITYAALPFAQQGAVPRRTTVLLADEFTGRVEVM